MSRNIFRNSSRCHQIKSAKKNWANALNFPYDRIILLSLPLSVSAIMPAFVCTMAAESVITLDGIIKVHVAWAGEVVSSVPSRRKLAGADARLLRNSARICVTEPSVTEERERSQKITTASGERLSRVSRPSGRSRRVSLVKVSW